MTHSNAELARRIGMHLAPHGITARVVASSNPMLEDDEIRFAAADTDTDFALHIQVPTGVGVLILTRETYVAGTLASITHLAECPRGTPAAALAEAVLDALGRLPYAVPLIGAALPAARDALRAQVDDAQTSVDALDAIMSALEVTMYPQAHPAAWLEMCAALDAAHHALELSRVALASLDKL